MCAYVYVCVWVCVYMRACVRANACVCISACVLPVCECACVSLSATSITHSCFEHRLPASADDVRVTPSPPSLCVPSSSASVVLRLPTTQRSLQGPQRLQRLLPLPPRHPVPRCLPTPSRFQRRHAHVRPTR